MILLSIYEHYSHIIQIVSCIYVLRVPYLYDNKLLLLLYFIITATLLWLRLVVSNVFYICVHNYWCH